MLVHKSKHNFIYSTLKKFEFTHPQFFFTLVGENAAQEPYLEDSFVHAGDIT